VEGGNILMESAQKVGSFRISVLGRPEKLPLPLSPSERLRKKKKRDQERGGGSAVKLDQSCHA